MEWVVLLGFLSGWVVGWIQATGKANFLPLLVKQLEKEKAMEYSQKYLLEKVKALELAQQRATDSELELVSVKRRARLRESELELVSDLAQSKAMGRD
jgi:hypothetical protein